MHEQFWEQLLKGLWNEFSGEGKRLLKLKAYSGALHALNGLRKLLFLQYCLMVLCFLVAAGTFGICWSIFAMVGSEAGVTFTPQLKFAVGLTAIASTLLYLTVRERTWVKATGIDRHLEELSSGHGAVEGDSSSTLDRELLEQVVSEAIDAKLSVYLSQTGPARASSKVSKSRKKSSSRKAA